MPVSPEGLIVTNWSSDRLRALFQAVAARGASGVVVLVLVVALTCVLTGTPAAAIYALAVLMVAFALMVVVVTVALRGRVDADVPAEEPRSAQQGEDESVE
ncbi:hypothetical protein [Amycolatopsis sp. NPDC051128]|uniref:hypothetical protein n=1 Tax=Amycolatopsis sp. NPDC051128 TaxID=3155412 RepID=UPI0034190695